VIRQTEFNLVSECSAVEHMEQSALFGEQSVRGLLQFSRCQLLLESW
jgi:hypothetical protein